jgi:hypothetical protein
MYALFPSSDKANDAGAADRCQHRQAAGRGVEGLRRMIPRKILKTKSNSTLSPFIQI